ncbi:MAG: MFS transporter [Betaproteobacteria bacterium]
MPPKNAAAAGARLPLVPVLAVTTAIQALSTLAALALTAIAPKAAADLGVSPALVGYQLGAVYLAALVMAPLAAGMVRRLGATRTGQLALWLCAAGCALSAVGTLPALAAGAVLNGLGYGCTNPPASQLLSRMPPTRHMNLVFSIKQCGVPIGGVLAGLMMPPLSLGLGWETALLVVAGLLVFLSAAVQPYRAAWDEDRDRRAAVLASPLEAVALVWRNRVLRWLALSSVAYAAVQLSLTGFLVTYLVQEAGLTLIAAGTILAVANAAGAAGRLSWGWLADRLGSGSITLILNGALAIVGALATAAIAAGWPLALVAAATALFGFCAIGWNGVFMAVIVRRSRPEEVALATGGSLAITYVGIVLGPAAFALLHDAGGITYATSYALLGVLLIAGMVFLALARRDR